MAYDAPNGFRAEVRDSDGGMKGIYGWTDEAGNLVTKTFLSDETGFRSDHITLTVSSVSPYIHITLNSVAFRYTDFSELGIQLPQLPFDLHPVAGQRKFPKDHDVDEEENEHNEEVKETPVTLGRQSVQLHPFGRLIPEIDAVVIEPSVRDQSDKFRFGENSFNRRPQAVGALAGRKGLGFYNRLHSEPQTSEVSRAFHLPSSLMYPYPLVTNYNLDYSPNIMYQKYLHSSPQYQRMTYSPWSWYL